MANVKISELPLGTPSSTSIFPFVDSGTTYQGAISAITSNGGSVIETTYSVLQDMVNGGGLTTGSYYIITDFRTCYDQPDYDYNRGVLFVDNYKEGPIDPIIVFATSANTLSTEAYQPSYPKDRIQYDVYFSQTERTSGAAYGRITERIDEFNNRTDYDHRTILFKRYRYYEINFDNPYQGTVQVSPVSETEMVVSGTGTNFLSISLNTKVGFDLIYNDYKVYEITNVVSDTEMTITGLTNITLSSGSKMFPADWDEYSSYFQNNVDDPSLFEEYYTFEGSDNFNNYIGNHANLYQWNENDFILANNVFHTRFIGNKFGDECYNNTFFDDCENNNIGNYFFNNITDDDFDGNLIGNYFYNNRTTSNFQYNRIGENFNNNYIVQNSFYRNNIGNGFEYNQISGDDFQNNEIGNGFNYNKLRNGQFYKNDIGNGFNNNTFFWNFYGNLVGNGFASNEIYCPFYDNVIGDYYGNNNLGDINDPSSNQFYENRIGYNFYNNSITAVTNNNIIGNDFESNTILSDFLYNQIFDSFKGNLITENGNFEFNKVGWGFSANQLSGYCGGNVFGTFSLENDFLGDFVNNTIDNWFYNNLIGDEFVNNKIGSYFQDNTIGNGFSSNQIGDSFQDNTIGDNFGYGYSAPQGNKIGNNFRYNTIGEYCYNNSITDNFMYNTVGNYFQWNIFNTNIDYTNFAFNYGNITGFSYTSSGTTAADNLYLGIQICGATESVGVDATFDVEVSGGTVIGVTGATEGRLYQNGDVLTILGTQIGGVTGEISTFSINKLSVKIYKPANSTYLYPADETEMDYLISNSPLFYTYYSPNIQGVSYSTETGVDEDNYGMVIEGYINIPSGDTYYFGLSSDDGSDAFIDGIKVADWYDAHGDSGNIPSGNQYPITLTAGTYPIKVRLQERAGGDVVNLLYSLDNSSWNIIPNDWFVYSVTGVTGSYPNVLAPGTGGGINATFDITVVDGIVSSVLLSNSGNSYSVGDILTISGSEFGGTDDITITVDSVYSDDVVITVTGTTLGSLFYEHYTKQIFERKGTNKRVSYYDENDILNVDSVYEISGYIPVYTESLSFPHTYTSFDFYCDGSYTNNGGYTNQTTNNITELVTLFNSQFRSSGYFFDNNDGNLGIYINPSLKQQWCPSGVYTVNVFND